jgi:hypothetical protein
MALVCVVASSAYLSPFQEAWGAPHPRFPEKFSGSREPHAPFLNERRTRCLVQCRVQEIRGISLVFREMWDTTALNVILSKVGKKVKVPLSALGFAAAHIEHK